MQFLSAAVDEHRIFRKDRLGMLGGEVAWVGWQANSLYIYNSQLVRIKEQTGVSDNVVGVCCRPLDQ